MSIEFARTRKKRWDDGNIYLLPTIRFKWTYGVKDYDEPATYFSIDVLWLTFKVSLKWISL